MERKVFLLGFLALVVAAFLFSTNIGSAKDDKGNPEQAYGIPKTGQTVSDAPGDDGDLQTGVPWPDQRFKNNGDGTVTDNLTGLVWIRDAGALGMLSWYEALDTAAKLQDGQYGLKDGSQMGDWRLPNINELHSLADYGALNPALPKQGHPFVGPKNYYITNKNKNLWGSFWSSTTFNYIPPSSSVPIEAYTGDFDIGDIGFAIRNTLQSMESSFFNVWCVRDNKFEKDHGKNETYNGVPRTGQIISYASGDDGDLQKGIPWPIPRFTDNGDATVTDNLTHLVWMKSSINSGVSWYDALKICANLKDGQYGLHDGSQAGDWRMPNLNELLSLVDYGVKAFELLFLPPGNPFLGIGASYYSSTTYGIAISQSEWFVNFGSGETGGVDKRAYGSRIYFWPVRDKK